MSLRDLTKDSHTAAEKTKFMRAVFKNAMPMDVWADWTYQKSLFYNAIESCADELGLLDDIRDIKRTFLLLEDYKLMIKEHSITSYNPITKSYNPTTIEYYKYVMNLYPDRNGIMAHLYVWHMGDLHGGQMIKKMISGSHLNLDFNRRDELIMDIRTKLDDSMADEANKAFNWAMRLMSDYDDRINL